LQGVKQASSEGATFIFTPETTHLMEMDRSAVLAKASYQADDAGLKALQNAAKEYGVWLHIGSLIIKVAEDRLVNRAFLINDRGEITAQYDKVHLFDVDLEGGESYRESALYDAGGTAVIAKSPLGILGLSICYDLRFPYYYRQMAEAGAVILTVPAAFTQQTGEAHWHSLLTARAIENGAFVIAAAQCGLHATGRRTYGHSLVISPWGDVLLDAGENPGVHVVDIDLTAIEKARKTVPSLSHSKDVPLKSF